MIENKADYIFCKDLNDRREDIFSSPCRLTDFGPVCFSCIHGLGRRIPRPPVGHSGQGYLVIIIYISPCRNVKRNVIERKR